MKPIRPIHEPKFNNSQRVLDRFHDILNGQVDRGGVDTNGNEQPGNMNNRHVRVTTPVTPNTEFSVTHNLNRIPVAANPVFKSASCDIYSSGTAWTTTTIFLKCTIGNVVVNLEIY